MENEYNIWCSNPLGLARLTLTDYYGEGKIITYIIVPDEHRGKGIGTQLLKACIADADKHGVTLWLEIAADGPLDYNTLEAWYKRYGFKGSNMYRRKPVPRAMRSAQASPAPSACGSPQFRHNSVVE